MQWFYFLSVTVFLAFNFPEHRQTPIHVDEFKKKFFFIFRWTWRHTEILSHSKSKSEIGAKY